ncbi:MAG: Stf0 family sulfotransferase [Pseudomonadota bacterium]
MTEPETCYTIWFSQRVGSTWLAEALASTGVAGRPREAFLAPQDRDATVLERVYLDGTTPNGVFGIKQGFSEPNFSDLLAWLAQGRPAPSRVAAWERVFPNHRHVFLTRRNKVRQAVSWWRAIQTGEWHRRRGAFPMTAAEDGYSFEAIDQLLSEAVLREAGIQEMFAEAGVTPLTLTYEDMAADLPGTVAQVLAFLGREGSAPIETTSAPTADRITETWVERFRTAKQAGWRNRGW